MAALATRTDDWTPDWASHPGEHLAEYIETRGWSQAELARLAGLTPKLVSTIVKGLNPVTPETAIRLERVLGVRAAIWANLQANYDLFRARGEEKSGIDINCFLSQFPIKEMKERGCLPKSDDEGTLLDSLLHLFGIGAAESYKAKVGALAVQHRQSKAHQSSSHHIFAWLMLGEQAARRMNLPAFEQRRFDESLKKIRTLTVEEPDVFEPRMKEFCRNAGIALVFERPIGKTCLFGSARWFDGDRAIIQMSLRMKSNDHFWWTFFHEAAHIVLHRGRSFVDDQNGVGGGAEKEADDWAEQALVGRERFAQFKAALPRTKAEVKAFADEINLHPGIVVGMLQHAGVLQFSHLNGLKARFEWTEGRKQ